MEGLQLCYWNRANIQKRGACITQRCQKVRLCSCNYFWREILLCCASTSHCSNEEHRAYYLLYVCAGKKNIQTNVMVFTAFRRITESGAWFKPRKLKQAVEEDRSDNVTFSWGWAGVCSEQMQAGHEREEDEVVCSCTLRERATERGWCVGSVCWIMIHLTICSISKSYWKNQRNQWLEQRCTPPGKALLDLQGSCHQQARKVPQEGSSYFWVSLRLRKTNASILVSYSSLELFQESQTDILKVSRSSQVGAGKWKIQTHSLPTDLFQSRHCTVPVYIMLVRYFIQTDGINVGAS